MYRTLAALVLAATVVHPVAALANKKGGKGTAPSSRAIGELAGKFKWGLSHDEVVKVIGGDIHLRYVELIKKESDTYKQDQLRRDEREEVEKVRASLVKFDGQKSGWDTSIVDHEFGHKNNESMLILWEKDQRRFLFFWNGKLYKQFIAFDAQHPVFAGKSFDDFAKLIQNRYGQAEMKFAQMRSKEDMTLDHLEWPQSGDFILWAVDHSSFYGNFCLTLTQASVVKSLMKAREEHSPRKAVGNALIDSVTSPTTVQGDANADVVDQIVGRNAPRTNQGNPAPAASSDSDTNTNSKKKKPEKRSKPGEKDPLEGMQL